jgi:hypothetical protein
MSSVDAGWQSLRPLDREALGAARTEAINLVQWLARIANSYVQGDAPEKRLALEFRPSDAVLVTKTFANALSLELRLPTLELQFRENGKPVPHIFNPEERSPAEVEAWLLVELLHRGVDRTVFSKALPYTVPGLLTGDAEDHSPEACKPALTQLMRWLQNAAAVLGTLPFAGHGIVCWPQTLALSCASSDASAQAYAGFSPGDGQNPEPHFYRRQPAQHGSSEAHSILTAAEILASRDPTALAIAFMTSAAT